MPKFKIINNQSDIALNNKWIPSTKFNSKDRLVDARGNKVGSGYNGRQYRIIEKRERNFSDLERFGRGFLGTLALVCTLCLAGFSKSVRNLFTKSKENIRFGIRCHLSSSSSTTNEHIEHPSLIKHIQSTLSPKPKEHIDIEKDTWFIFQENEKHAVEDIENFIDQTVNDRTASAIENIASILPPKPKEDIYIDIDKDAPRFFFKEEEQHVVKNIEKLIDETTHFYMTSDMIFANCIEYIEKNGFIRLANQVLEHPELDNWIMKGGGQHRRSMIGGVGPNDYDNIMRVFMAERMSKAIEEEQLDIVIPEKRLLLSKKNAVKGLHEKYYVFSKKLEILDEVATKKALRQLPQDQQRKIARNICQLIKKTGFMDAHFGNIRWYPAFKKIAIIDTESQGLLIETNDPSPHNINTIKNCALIGLQELKNRTGGEFPIFAEEADKARAELLEEA